MREIPAAFLDIPTASDRDPFLSIGELNEKLQKAKDAVIPERSAQGPIFCIGEILEIRGGKFPVHAITEKRIYLDSLPRDAS